MKCGKGEFPTNFPIVTIVLSRLLQLLFYVLQTKGLQANKVFSKSLLTENVFTSVTTLQEWILLISDVAMDQLHHLNEKTQSLIK
ncbi:hypothetical protein ACI2OX_03165 [Bacillus sp. N9]